MVNFVKMILKALNMKSNQFTAKYYQTNKPKVNRGNDTLYILPSFEKVLVSVLDMLCERVYFHSDWILREGLIIKPIFCNKLLCEYSVKIPDLKNENKILKDYIIQIECNFDNGIDDVLEPNHDLDFIREEKVIGKIEKEKNHTKWYLKESLAIRFFLLLLYQSKNLEELKTKISKATYYRNLKICLEKGYIVDGKLKRKIFF